MKLLVLKLARCNYTFKLVPKINYPKRDLLTRHSVYEHRLCDGNLCVLYIFRLWFEKLMKLWLQFPCPPSMNEVLLHYVLVTYVHFVCSPVSHKMKGFVLSI